MQKGFGTIDHEYEEIMQMLPTAIYICDTEGRITFFNRAAAELWGREPEIGKDMWCGSWKIYDTQMVPVPLYNCTMAQTIRDGIALQDEEIIIGRPDGTFINVRPQPKVLYDNQGNRKGAVTMFLNVAKENTLYETIKDTEKRHNSLNDMLEKRVQERTSTLAESEQRYHKMIDEVQDYAILLLDLDGNILNWNKGAENIKGYSEKEIVGKNFSLFYMEEDRANNLPGKLIGEAVQSGRAKHEGWRVRKDGTRFWGNIVITALHDEDGNTIGFSKVTRDLTEKKLAEDQLLASASSLELRNKQLEEYAYVASHDLQEPLRKIQTFARLLQSNSGNPDLAIAHIEKIISSSERMSILIKDLLKYSQVLHSEDLFIPIDLNEVLKNVQEDFDLLIEQKQADVRVSKLPSLKGIPVQIHQLFSNLLSNSLKFSSEYPLIEISSLKASREDIRDHIGSEESRNYHWLTFSDNGTGFDQKYAEQAFKMFQRLTDSKTGTGIGLSLCKRVVENHNGHITVDSLLGSGTTFKILLPE